MASDSARQFGQEVVCLTTSNVTEDARHSAEVGDLFEANIGKQDGSDGTNGGRETERDSHQKKILNMLVY